jgi:hypothetical protein
MFLRYLFIEWLKNPALVLDEFWYRVIGFWIMVLCATTQLVFVLLPGVFACKRDLSL